MVGSNTNWRRQCDNFPFEKRDFPQPFWEGTDPKDKSILVWTEQGIGDEIMFSSILPDLLNRNANVIVESDTRMVSLFQRSFPKTRFIPRQNPPNSQLLNTTVDYQTPIGSLGNGSGQIKIVLYLIEIPTYVHVRRRLPR